MDVQWNKFHPILFAVFPIFFLFANNRAELYFSDIIVPALVAITCAGLLFVIIRFFTKNSDKALAITSVYVLMFFSYGYIYDAIRENVLWGFEYGRARYLLLLYIIFIPFVFLKISRIKKDIRILNSFLFIFSLSMIVLSVVNIGLFHITSTGGNDVSTYNENIDIKPTEPLSKENFPDIYYFILDAYGNESTLQELYGYDNVPFLNALEDRGFYVAHKSISNFAATHISLSSSLNMEYVNYLTQVVEGKDIDFNPTAELIKNNKVWRFLKTQGYKFINFRSIWGGTSYNEYADVNFQGGKLSEFSMLLFNTTLFRATALSPKLYGYVLGDFRERTLYTFENIPRVAQENYGGPKFVFAHFMLPHPPFVFGPNGEKVLDSAFELNVLGWNEKEKKQYIDQVQFANKKVLEMVDAIKTNSQRPAVIILQGDHGPWSTAGEDRENNRLYKERMRIFNAYHLPQGGESVLYESITPVNSFRAILNYYFKTNLPLLEDKSFFSDTVSEHIRKTPYDFHDVTDIVQF